MAILLAMIFGLAGGAIALALGALLAMAGAEIFHMSNREGAHGYFAILIGVPAGILGMIATMVFTLRWRGVTSLAGATGGTIAAIAGIAAVGACCFGLFYLSIPHQIRPQGPPVYLLFEIAPPPGSAPPDLAVWDAELNATKTRMGATWDSKANGTLDGRATAKGRVELVYRLSDRLLVLRLPNNEERVFRLRLPANPTAAKYRNWSEWRKADFAGNSSGVTPITGTDYLIRYQIEE